jgi:cytosine/adenosine deaminase-related metal-dependent hydrolase
MRCFQADFVFPVHEPPLKDGMIVTDDQGVILDVCLPGRLDPGFGSLNVEHLKGILVPGFINTHCHLELSCMKGQISPDTGMAGFVSEFVSKRGMFSEAERMEAITRAEEEMISAGIVAVGDIANGNSTFSQKAKKNLYYHTFVEAFDLHPSRARESFERARLLREELVKLMPGSDKQVSVVPHAPYTVSPDLHRMIADYARKHKLILSIHNQESIAEDQFFRKGEGALIDMYKRMGLDFSWFTPTGKSSLDSTLREYASNAKLLLVHNTYTSEEDLEMASSFLKTENKENCYLYWATCPKANLCIEGRLPDYNLFLSKNLKLTVGTDSLASNTGLSVLEELKTISRLHPQIPTETLLRWATLNGAEFLGIEEQYGSFEKGKKPGVVLIEGSGLTGFSEDAVARRVI